MARYLYSELASTVAARRNCIEDADRLRASGPNNEANLQTRLEWIERHTDRIETLVSEYMPSGSGFDNGTKLDFDTSHANKLVFTTAFHHMNESGMYDDWTEHTVTVTPSFIGGFNLRVSGRNQNDIKDYIGDTFAEALRTELPEPATVR